MRTVFISVLDLHLNHRLKGNPGQRISEIVVNPRGCPGKTHVKLQNGPAQCWDNCAEVEVLS
jgi:hypothetical protein